MSNAHFILVSCLLGEQVFARVEALSDQEILHYLQAMQKEFEGDGLTFYAAREDDLTPADRLRMRAELKEVEEWTMSPEWRQVLPGLIEQGRMYIAATFDQWAESEEANDLADEAWRGMKEAEAELPPLTEGAKAVYDLLCELPQGAALSGKEVLNQLAERGYHLGQSSFTKYIVPALRPWGLESSRQNGAGYRIPMSKRRRIE